MKLQLLHLRLLLPALLILFISCQEDYDGLRPKAASSRPVTQEPISFQEIKATMPGAYAAISRIDATTAALAKSNFHNTKYGFSIDTLEGRILKRGNYHSITYPIYRDISSETLENLVLNLRKDGKYTAVIVQYDLSLTEQKVLAGGDGLDLLNRKVVITEIDVSTMGSNYSLDNDVICYQSPLLFVQPCSSDEHGSWNPGEWHDCSALQKPVIFISFRTICEEGGPTDGGSTPGSGSTGTGGGGAGGQVSMGNPHPVQTIGPQTPQQPKDDFEDMLTSPVVRGDLANATSGNPCIELKKMTNNSNIKSTFQTLETKTGEDKENGFTFHRGPTYDTPTPTQIDPLDPFALKMPFGGDIIGGNHTHPNPIYKGIPMFSNTDVEYLFLAASQYSIPNSDKSMFVLTLTVPQGTYAIKIKDFYKFTLFINSKRKELDKNLRERYFKRAPTDPTNEFVKDFLSVLKQMDSGVSLYKAAAGYSNWSELTLDPATNEIIKTDCN